MVRWGSHLALQVLHFLLQLHALDAQLLHLHELSGPNRADGAFQVLHSSPEALIHCWISASKRRLASKIWMRTASPIFYIW